MTSVAANGADVKPALEAIRLVWIDQDLCTGDGLCTQIVPELFHMGDDGLAYVTIDGELQTDPGGAGSLANVPQGREGDTLDASLECPGECIFVTDGAGNTLTF